MSKDKFQPVYCAPEGVAQRSAEEIIDNLLERYADRIVFGKKSGQELIAWLGERMSYHILPPSCLIPLDFQIFQLNLMNDLTLEDPMLLILRQKFVVIRIRDDEKSAFYYKRHRRGHRPGMTDCPIELIMEQQTGYFACNSNELGIDLRIEQGINREDYHKKDLNLLGYLTQFQFKYEELEPW